MSPENDSGATEADDLVHGQGRLSGDARDSRARLRRVGRSKTKPLGGFRFASAFLGWLAAIGAAVILMQLAAVLGGTLGFDAHVPGTPLDGDDAATAVNGVVLGLVLLFAYLAGGYVAGRITRVDGAKQGAAVWMWAVAVAVVTATVAATAGSRWDLLSALHSFPRIPTTSEPATTASRLTDIFATVVALTASTLVGMTGARQTTEADEAEPG